MRHSPSDLSQMAAAIHGTQIAARQWLEAGFSPGDAAAYVRAGCFDVDRTVELRRAGLTPSHIARLGFGWDYCAGRVTLEELLECYHPVPSPELAWDVSATRERQGSDRSPPRWLRSTVADRTLQQQAS